MERSRPDLAMNWSRTEGELVVRLYGANTEDGRALVAILDRFALAELERRGFDLRTLRFSIRKKKGAVKG